MQIKRLSHFYSCVLPPIGPLRMHKLIENKFKFQPKKDMIVIAQVYYCNYARSNVINHDKFANFRNDNLENTIKIWQ